MKKCKKILSVVLTLAMLLSLTTVVHSDGSEMTSVISQSPYVNVALNKPVVVSNSADFAEVNFVNATAADYGDCAAAFAADGINPRREDNYALLVDGICSRQNNKSGGNIGDDNYSDLCHITADGNGDVYAIIDLQKEYNISHIDILAHLRTLKIQVVTSTDMVNWSAPYTYNNTHYLNKGNFSEGNDTSSFWVDTHRVFLDSQKPVRYVKVYRDDTLSAWSGADGLWISEIEVYAAKGYDEHALKNVQAVAATITNDSTALSGASDDITTGSVFDSFWAGTSTDGSVVDVTFDIGENQNITSMFLTGTDANGAYTGAMEDFKVYVSDSLAGEHVEKTAANLVWEQKTPYSVADHGTLAIECGKNGRYITFSKNAKAAGETNNFAIAHLQVNVGKGIETKKTILENVAAKDGVTIAALAGGASFTGDLTNLIDGTAATQAYMNKTNDVILMIDLGAWYNVKKVALTTVDESVNNTDLLKNVNIIGSMCKSWDNDGAEVLLANLGPDTKEYSTRYEMDVKASNIVRYIYLKTRDYRNKAFYGNGYIGAAEIEIYAEKDVSYRQIPASNIKISAGETGAFTAIGRSSNGSVREIVSNVVQEMIYDSSDKLTFDFGSQCKIDAIGIVGGNYKAYGGLDLYGYRGGATTRGAFAFMSGKYDSATNTTNFNVNNYTQLQNDSPYLQQSSILFDKTISTRQLQYTKLIDGHALYSNAANEMEWDNAAKLALMEIQFFAKNIPVDVTDVSFTDVSTPLYEMYSFNANVINNTEAPITVRAYLAIYNSSGSMLDGIVVEEPVTVDAGATEPIGVELLGSDGYDPDEGDIIKVFVWEEGSLKPFYGDVQTIQ